MVSKSKTLTSLGLYYHKSNAPDPHRGMGLHGKISTGVLMFFLWGQIDIFGLLKIMVVSRRLRKIIFSTNEDF